MENQNPDEFEVPIEDSGADNNQIESSKGRSRSWLWMSLIGVFTLLVIAGMSAVGGMEAGKADRIKAEATVRADQIQEQYVLAMLDLNEGNDLRARQRFEWIINHDPNFPGVPEQLADIIHRMGITATPTTAPTPTLTPTPDTRSRDELYEAAKLAMLGQDWTTAIETALKLRKEAPDFHPIEVDGWLYISLRYRGVDKIKNADLEGGTYDLALAERFGPLDSEANNYRTWADLYVTGASFWDVDWQQAVSYFSQLKLVAPYLRDGSGWTSMDRYRIALAKYADWLFMQGLCEEALQNYEASLIEKDDPQVQATATYVAEECAVDEPDIDEDEQLPTMTPGTPEVPWEITPTPPSGEAEATATPEVNPEISPTP
jgi:tetratricopeptide (TPR) repeat protein